MVEPAIEAFDPDEVNRQLVIAIKTGTSQEVYQLLASIPTGEDHLDLVQALNKAASLNQVDVVKWLLWPAKFGLTSPPVDINAHNGSALCNAVMDSSYDMVRFLLENGADPNPEYGNLVLDSACGGLTKMVWLLLYYGASIKSEEVAHGPDAALYWAAYGYSQPRPRDILDQGPRDSYKATVKLLLDPQKYGLDIEGCQIGYLAQSFHQMLPIIQDWEQEDLYQKVRLMYYILKCAKQHEMGNSAYGALKQVLDNYL